MTARGKELYEKADRISFTDRIDSLEQDVIVAPLKPLLELLKLKLKSLEVTNKLEVSLEGVNWCLNHGLIPQAYILLYELSITAFCSRFGLNYMEIKDREFISSLISVVSSKKPQSEWKGGLAERKKSCSKNH